MRVALRKERVIGTRMKVPGYPSNREADERAGRKAIEATAKSGKVRK